MSATPALAIVKATVRPVVEHASCEQPEAAGAPIPAATPLPDRKPVGLGLPCAKCKAYYPSDLKVCPLCKSSERVEVSAVRAPAAPSQKPPAPVLLEQELERFLPEFKVQVATLQISEQPAAFSPCIKAENHVDGVASAAICQDCYEHLQDRVDVFEAALYMDVKEAAQIVFDAVWADPSDPPKTYANAANALLGELRKRSGLPGAAHFAPLPPTLAD